MINVKIKNSTYILTIFLLVYFSCNDTSNKTIRSVKKEKGINNHKSLIFNINFETYGAKSLAFDKKTISIDPLVWKNHKKDTVVYFNINLRNIKKEPFAIKTSLVSTNIPFVIEYQKLNRVDKYRDGTKTEYFNLNIVQQFNTVYKDSIIFKIDNIADFPIADQVFRIGYQKVGVRSLCELPFEWKSDTLDISNPKNKHICCIEVDR